LLKSIRPKKLKGFFYAYHFGVPFDQKMWFEKRGILVIYIEKFRIFEQEQKSRELEKELQATFNF
jgi:uncharacterized membrane protein YobD (UPF0266 family)